MLPGSSRITPFYRDGAVGPQRTLVEIHGLSDEMLERVHDWVQWVFPLPERSTAQPHTPVLHEDDLELFLTHPDVLARVKVMHARYQLFLLGNDHWRGAFDHNHLRITRAIRSLTLMGANEEAEDLFQEACKAMGGALPTRTRWFWSEARRLEPEWLS
jgi:hypothetical protein